jgi:NAD(P)-dependent dehydrogenase (short-subunit alcohol dehydrogenase family)
MRLTDTCAIVTGAASGLGRATAGALHAGGAQVVLADINAEKLEAVARTLGERALPVVVDVREPDQIEAALDRANKTFGAVRVAVNCASRGDDVSWIVMD